jgi:hypothetical protein
MKKIVILLMAIVLLGACNNNKAKGKGGLFGGLGGNNKETNNDRNKDDYNNNKDDKNKDNNNGGGGWSNSDRNAFLQECKTQIAGQAGVPGDLCSCVLGKLEKEFTDLNDLNARGTEEEGRKLSQQCINGNKEDNGNGGGGIGGGGNGGGNGGGSGWTKEDEKKWNDVCITGNPQTDKLCPCVLEKLEKKYPTFEEANTKGTREEGQKLGKECANEMGGNSNNNNDNNNSGNGSWTSEQFQQFSQGCATAAQRNFNYSPQQARSYCDCLTKKVEQQYNFQQAAKLTAQDFQTDEWNKAKVDCQPGN